MIFGLLFLLVAYIIGSIPSAIIVAKLMGLPDPRTQGSQNPGATNMLRIAGKKSGIIVLAGDVLKGIVTVSTANWLDLPALIHGFTALAVVLGHVYPIFFGFKGGKGVATAGGALIALSWPLAIAAITTWLLVAILFRYSSLAAIIATIATPFYSLWLTSPSYWIAILLVSFLLLWRHRDNIRRLMSGEETKIGVPRK